MMRERTRLRERYINSCNNALIATPIIKCTYYTQVQKNLNAIDNSLIQPCYTA